MSVFKQLTILCGVVLCSQPIWAQAGALKVVAKDVSKVSSRHIPWEKAVRIGGLSCVRPQEQVGVEILRGRDNSFIGSIDHMRFDRVLNHTYFLGSTLSRAVAQQIVKPVTLPPQRFVGFYPNFPQAWRHFMARTKSTGGIFEVILEAAYGESEQFSGHFVSTFNEVMALADSPVEYPVQAQKAFKQALTQAKELESGFFVIRIAGNDQRSKDTLLLDVEQVGFISYNHSKGNAWAKILQERAQPDEIYQGQDAYLNDWKKDPTITDRRTTQGIILQVDGRKTPKTISISLNGHSWTIYHLNASEAYSAKEVEEALNIWTAWNKGYYILYDEGTGRVLFASAPGKPLFSTLKEVEEYVARQKELKGHPPVVCGLYLLQPKPQGDCKEVCLENVSQ